MSEVLTNRIVILTGVFVIIVRKYRASILFMLIE